MIFKKFSYSEHLGSFVDFFPAYQPFPLILAKNDSLSIKKSLSINWQGCQSRCPTFPTERVITNPGWSKYFNAMNRAISLGWAYDPSLGKPESFSRYRYDLSPKISGTKCSVGLELLVSSFPPHRDSLQRRSQHRWKQAKCWGGREKGEEGERVRESPSNVSWVLAIPKTRPLWSKCTSAILA